MSDQVAEIKSRVDIASLIGERVPLKQRGQRFVGLCPFHSEKTPSFTVSPELGIYKCFGCSKSGDVYTFLQEYEGMSFVEALEFLAQKTGVKLERRAIDSRQDKTDKIIYEVNHLAAEYYHYLLTQHQVGQRARKYLTHRQITKRAIDHFLIGYSLNRWDGLLTFLTKKGYQPELLEKAGLIIRRTRDEGQGTKEKVTALHPSAFSLRPSDCYDRFRGRVMFPLRDPRGQVAGFAGRLLDVSAQEAKYINSPETPIYHKGRHLFGIFENRVAIHKADRAILVEGELDAISSWQMGLTNVCAVKGTALTVDQIKLIRRYTRNLTMSLDADAAGWEALVRSLPLLESAGMNVRVAVVAGAKDPDELIKQHPDTWRDIVGGARNVYEALIRGHIARAGGKTGEEKKQASEKIIPILSGISNAIEQDHWINETAKLLGVREDSIRRQIEIYARSGQIKPPGTSSSNATSGKRTRAETLSQYLLALVLAQPVALDKLAPQWLQPIGIRKIIEFIQSRREQDRHPNIRQLRQALPAELTAIFDEAALSNLIGEDKGSLSSQWWQDELERTIVSLEQEYVKKSLKQPELSMQNISDLTKRLRALTGSG